MLSATLKLAYPRLPAFAHWMLFVLDVLYLSLGFWMHIFDKSKEEFPGASFTPVNMVLKGYTFLMIGAALMLFNKGRLFPRTLQSEVDDIQDQLMELRRQRDIQASRDSILRGGSMPSRESPTQERDFTDFSFLYPRR